MEIELEILAELSFDAVTTLKVIEKDADLLAIFRFDVKHPIPDLIILAERNELDEDTLEVVKAIFNGIVLTKHDYVELYQKLDKRPKTEPIAEVAEPVQPIKKIIQRKAIPDDKLPRRYGKEKILKDIEKQGGVATPTQNAMLKLNDLKNIWTRLNNKGIKDMLGDARVLTDDEARQITAAVSIMEQKVNKILKIKK